VSVPTERAFKVKLENLVPFLGRFESEWK